MEEQAKRQYESEHREEPAAYTCADSETCGEWRALGQHAGALKREEDRRSAVAAAGRQRDHDVVHDPAEQKAGEDRHPRAPAERQRPKQHLMREVAERRVPAAPPEFAEARRTERRTHQR